MAFTGLLGGVDSRGSGGGHLQIALMDRFCIFFCDTKPRDCNMQVPWARAAGAHLAFFVAARVFKTPVCQETHSTDLYILGGQCYPNGRRYGAWRLKGSFPFELYKIILSSQNFNWCREQLW